MLKKTGLILFFSYLCLTGCVAQKTSYPRLRNECRKTVETWGDIANCMIILDENQ